MSSELKLIFDTGDRSVCATLNRVVSTFHRSAEKKMLEGNLAAARKDVLKSYQIITGMNPVLAFVRECVKRADVGRVSTDEAYALFERRVRRGDELPVKRGVFGAHLRRAIDQEFSIRSRIHNGKVFEGVQLYGR